MKHLLFALLMLPLLWACDNITITAGGSDMAVPDTDVPDMGVADTNEPDEDVLTDHETGSIIGTDDDVLQTPPARVVVRLAWEVAASAPAGVAIDLDLHFVKKRSMDPCGNERGSLGLLCSQAGEPMAMMPSSLSQDDCSVRDIGCNVSGSSYPICSDCSDAWPSDYPKFGTIPWRARFIPGDQGILGDDPNAETIHLGPVSDGDNDGLPDHAPLTDDYLVVVNYRWCRDLSVPEVETGPACQADGSHYNIQGRIEILVDGRPAPRDGTDDEELPLADFVIRPQEWLVLGVVSWDGARTTGMWPGDAVVMKPSAGYRVCRFDTNHCGEDPIWDIAAYEKWVAGPADRAPYDGAGGECYEYGVRE